MNLIIIFMLAISALHAEQIPETTRPRYISGGIVGTAVGFGIGHGIQQRYSKGNAWIFTLAEAATISYVVTANILDNPEGNPDRTVQNQASDRAANRLLVGGLVLLALKTWETIDVWTGIKIGQELDLAVVPAIVGRDTAGLMLAKSF